MKRLAIVGVTGLVGQSVLDVLKEEDLADEFELYLFGSERSAGKKFEYNGKNYALLKLDDSSLDIGFDYAIFLTDELVSGCWVKKFAESGVVVIDNSSAFRLDKNVPLIVPEINIKKLEKNNRIIANPNCSTIQLVVVLDKLRWLGEFETIVVSSYQSVSGAGKDALDDLKNGTTNVFEREIRDNFIARIGKFSDNLNCSEENKIILETQKILNEKINIVATTVRVPISFCHGESVYVKFKNKVDFEMVNEVLNCEYIEVGDLFYPKDCVGTNQTFVCRLRKVGETELAFFVIADNLRRGASYNAVKILKEIIKG